MIEFYRVSKEYHGRRVLKNLSFQIAQGEFVFLTGPSGAGKTTVLKLLYRAEGPGEGQILVNGTNVGAMPPGASPSCGGPMGIVFQDYKLLPSRTVFENVSFVLKFLGVPLAERRRRAYQVLRLVELHHRVNALPEELSGGEQQRVALARALVNEPELLIADEPTGNLDHRLAQEVMRLFSQINVRGTTVLVATHDVNLIRETGRRCLTLDRGGVLEGLVEAALPPQAGWRREGGSSSRLATRTRGEAGRRVRFAPRRGPLGPLAGAPRDDRLDPPDLLLPLPRRPLPPRCGEPRRRRRHAPRGDRRHPVPPPERGRGVEGGPRANARSSRSSSPPSAGLGRGGAGPLRPLVRQPRRRGGDPLRKPVSRRSVELDLLPGAISSAALRPFLANLAASPAVEEVQFDVDWIRRLRGIVRLVAAAGLAAGVFLALGAAFTIANVVRLTILLHRDEIEILRLVGAPEVLIRGPFLLGGVLQGFLGGLAALGFLAIAFRGLLFFVASTENVLLGVFVVRFLSPAICGILVLGGVFAGLLGGTIASRRGHV